MTPAQLFGVVVRTIGLLMTIWGTISSCMGLAMIMAGGLIISVLGTVAMLVGLWLMRGPQILIAFAYPDESAGRSTIESSLNPHNP